MQDFGTKKTKAAVADSIKNLGFGSCSSRPQELVSLLFDPEHATVTFTLRTAHGGKAVLLAAYKAPLDAKAAGQIRSVGVSN
jgi:hypothetical protein